MMKKLYIPLCLAVCILFTFSGLCIAKDQAALKVKKIIFTIDKDGREKVAMMCNQSCIPDVFTIEDEQPRVVMDLKEVSSIEAGYRHVQTRGKFVKKIRSYLDKESKKLRVVLDMDPAKYYIVHPMQNEPSDHIYFLRISEQKPAGDPNIKNSMPSADKHITILRPDLGSVEKGFKSKEKEDKPEQVGDVKIARDEISVNRGRSQMNAGDFTGAVETFTKIVSENPRDSLGYRLRGNAYDNLGDRRKAIGDWMTAARLGDEIIQSYLDFLRVKWRDTPAP